MSWWVSWILYSGVAALLIYETLALSNRLDGDTISEIVWSLSTRPIVPFTFGLLMGHFFWQAGK